MKCKLVGIIFMCVGLLFVEVSHAKAEKLSPIALTFEVAPIYLWENGATFSKDPVAQTALRLAWRDLYGEFWWSTGFDGDLSSDLGDESRFTIGWAPRFKTDLAPIRLDVGATLINFIEQDDIGNGDVIKYHLGACADFQSRKAGTFSPCMKFQYIDSLERLSLGPVKIGLNGWYIHAGVEHNITSGAFWFHQELGAFWDSGALIFEPGVIAAYKGTSSWRMPFLNDLWLNLPSVEAFAPLWGADERSPIGVVTAGFEWSFPVVSH